MVRLREGNTSSIKSLKLWTILSTAHKSDILFYFAVSVYE